MPPITGILCNPASGRVRNSLTDIKQVLNKIPETTYREAVTSDEIQDTIMSFSDKQVSLLILIGGDGTVHTSLTHMFRHWNGNKPAVAVIPGGTTNMTAFDLGVHGNPWKCISLLADWLATSHPLNFTSREVLHIVHGDDINQFGMFFGCGLIPHGVEYFHETIGKSGITSELTGGLVMFRYVLSLLFIPGKWPVTPLTIIRNDGVTDYQRCLTAFVTTLDRLLLGVRPFRCLRKGSLFFTIIDNSMRSVWKSVFFLLAGNCTRCAGEIIDDTRNKIEFLIDGRFIVDGEFYNARRRHGPVSISRCGPVKFLIL